VASEDPTRAEGRPLDARPSHGFTRFFDDPNLVSCAGLARFWVSPTGQVGSVLSVNMSASTLGTFLRSFTFGHVRRLDAVASRLLINWLGRSRCRSSPTGCGMDRPIAERGLRVLRLIVRRISDLNPAHHSELFTVSGHQKWSSPHTVAVRLATSVGRNRWI
jgi:hypothetical protein